MAGPTRATGHPDYSSSGSSSFIPAYWSGKLVESFYDGTVWNEISNTDYEGEITAAGDKVVIRTIPEITVSDYVVGGGLSYEKPSSAKVELAVDRAKSFAFEVNRVDEYQSDINLMDKWAEDASERMKIAVDQDVLGNIYADADATNKGASAGEKSASFNLGAATAPVALTKTNILDFLVDMGTVLDEASAPETNRWVVLPAWACGMLKKSDLKDASMIGDGTSALRTGRLGIIDRFTVYSSNNIASGTDTVTVYNIIAGHPGSLTFAAQITETEDLKNPNDFGSLVRGLMVYGYKVTNGKGIVHGYVSKG